MVARGKRGQTLSGHTISKSNQLPSKGSDPFCHGLLVAGFDHRNHSGLANWLLAARVPNSLAPGNNSDDS